MGEEGPKPGIPLAGGLRKGPDLGEDTRALELSTAFPGYEESRRIRIEGTSSRCRAADGIRVRGEDF
jgi:hypothetical protein